MGEREINHIATGMSPQPRGKLITHGHGDEEFDGEVQPGVEAAAGGSHGAAAAAARGGGGGPWRWCWYGGGSPPQDGCLGGGKFVVLGASHDLGFPSLYRLSDFRHPLLEFHQNGTTGRVRTPIGLISGLKFLYGKL